MGRPQSSPIHKYFDFDKTTSKSVCKTCRNQLKGKHPGCLEKHLSLHKDVFTQFESEKKQVLATIQEQRVRNHRDELEPARKKARFSGKLTFAFLFWFLKLIFLKLA